MAKLMAPNIRIDWYPEGHFADIQNPTVAELNSGYNLSCAIVTGYTLDFTDSNTEDTTTIFDDFTSESILNHSYEADLQFFLAPRDSIAGNEEAYRKAEELFYDDQNPKGYLAKRFGFPGDSKYVGNQKVDLFLLQADLPKVLSEEDNPVLLNIRFLPQGEAVSGVTVLGQLIKVTAVEPTWKDSPNLYLKGGGTWSTPAVEGVIYDRPSGTAKGGETVTVSARPKTGYEIAGSTSWSHTFPEKLPNVSYEWEGSPHESPSVKRVYGEIVARNLAINGDFENGIYGWSVSGGSGSAESEFNGRMWGGLGGHMLQVTHNSSGRFVVARQDIPVQPSQWVAVAYYVATDTDVEHQAEFYWQNDGALVVSNVTGWSSSFLFYEGDRFVRAFQAPSTADTLSLRLPIRVPADTNGRRAWFDKITIAAADSEQAALDQVAEYFDGDTPDEYL